MGRPAAPDRRVELARKLTLLVDVVLSPGGEKVTYSTLSAWLLEERDVRLSRARWSYMLNGTGKNVSDPRLLSAIADFFAVDPSYLLQDEGELPRKIETALQFVRADRLGEVRLFAARKLGEVSPEVLEKLTKIIDEASEAVHDSRERSTDND